MLAVPMQRILKYHLLLAVCISQSLGQSVTDAIVILSIQCVPVAPVCLKVFICLLCGCLNGPHYGFVHLSHWLFICPVRLLSKSYLCANFRFTGLLESQFCDSKQISTQYVITGLTYFFLVLLVCPEMTAILRSTTYKSLLSWCMLCYCMRWCLHFVLLGADETYRRSAGEGCSWSRS